MDPLLFLVTENALRLLNGPLKVVESSVSEENNCTMFAYMPLSDSFPVVCVSVAAPINFHDIWYATMETVIGMKGLCNPAHVGRKIGFITLNLKADPVHLCEKRMNSVMDLHDTFVYYKNRLT